MCSSKRTIKQPDIRIQNSNPDKQKPALFDPTTLSNCILHCLNLEFICSSHSIGCFESLKNRRNQLSLKVYQSHEMHRNTRVILICTMLSAPSMKCIRIWTRSPSYTLSQEGAETCGIITMLWIFHHYIIVELCKSIVTHAVSLEEGWMTSRQYFAGSLGIGSLRFSWRVEAPWSVWNWVHKQMVYEIQRKSQTWWFFFKTMS